MITFIIGFYLVSCVLFNILFIWHDSKNGVTIKDLILTIILSLIPILNTIGVIWILNEQGISDKVIFKRGSK